MDRCLAGHSLFVTGGGGVGKSYLTSAIVKTLRDQGRRVAVTASTGVAASLIHGQTLHSLLGLGLADKPVDDLVRIARARRKLVHTWRRMDVLVIDEVSMIDPDFFIKVDLVVQGLRESTEPFGGLQLLLIGDFFQLPPVHPRTRSPALPKFVFETEVWDRVVDECIELTLIHRQDDASEFARILKKIRTADMDLDDIETLTGRVNLKPDHVDGVIPTQMCSRRNSVAELNMSHLEKLDVDTSKKYTYTMKCVPVGESAHVHTEVTKFGKEVEKNMHAPKSLELREGAQVMMLVNQTESGLVNGSRGVVVGWEDGDPVVRFKHVQTTIGRHTWTFERELVGEVKITQIPLQLAWAMTIHKSQGTSLDCAEVSLDRSVFEYGQAYVALSRVRSLEGLNMVKFDHRVIRADPRVKAFYAKCFS